MSRPTSLDLIDEALAEGTIDQETAIAYKLYYLFGDGRLPAEYSTPLDPESYAGEGFLRDLRANFAQLSPDAQETVGPYVVQPFYEAAGGTSSRRPHFSTRGGYPTSQLT